MSSHSKIILKKKQYFSQIPSILSYLTYENDEGIICRLSPIARELYRVILSSGDHCWKDRNTLAFECHCSTGAITNAKKELSSRFLELNGKSLIIIEKEARKQGGKDKDILTAVDIQLEATAFMSRLLEDDKFDKNGLEE